MRSKKTVIFSLLDTPAFGGAEQYLFSHLKFLHGQGYEIYLATNNLKVQQEIQARLTKKEQRTFQVVKAPYLLDAIGNWKGLVKFFVSLPIALAWCGWTLWQLNTHYSQVICLWPGFSDRLVFSAFARLFNNPLLWIEIGPLEPTFKKNWGFPKWLYAWGQLFPNHLITTSLFTQKSIFRNTRFTPREVTLIYPGALLFSLAQRTKYQRLGSKLYQLLHLKGKVIGVVARLAHENEVDNVIRAFGLFLKKYSKATLLIIGDGPQRPELEELVKRLKLESSVHFSGFVTEEEKRSLLANCAFFVFPRAWELDGFGMTTIEAMALGVPVLTTDFGPQIEIVTNDEEGYRYSPHNPKALATYLQRMMILSPTKRRKMSELALTRVKNFSETRSHQAMGRVIRKFAVATV